MERMLPAIETVVARYRERTIFSRFITPMHPDDRPGQWRSYFRRWERATRQHLRGNDLDLIPSLARYVPPALVVDKPGYSAFMQSKLYDLLVQKERQHSRYHWRRDRRLRAGHGAERRRSWI